MKSYSNILIFMAAAVVGFVLCGGCDLPPEASDFKRGQIEKVGGNDIITIYRIHGHIYISNNSSGMVHAHHCQCMTNQ